MNDVNLTPSILGIASVRAGQTSAQREAGTLGGWSLNTRSGLEGVSGDVKPNATHDCPLRRFHWPFRHKPCCNQTVLY